MLLSMTGYGKSKDAFNGRSYSIDIKTLNGKVPDLRLKSPAFLRPKEIEIRKIIMDKLVRGKIDCTIAVLDNESDVDYKLNIGLFENYLNQLTQLTDKHQLNHQDLLQTIIRIPNVIQNNDEQIDHEEWNFIKNLISQAIDDLNSFRREEGSSLFKDLSARVNTIKKLLDEVAVIESKRKDELLTRLRGNIEEHLSKESLDENRLEQELIYYLEKLDIHEEKVRLAQHCSFFNSTLVESASSLGKKLNFIAQEMGREINTLGSKAQYSPLQQIVVQMKVELDQIKEQLANVL